MLRARRTYETTEEDIKVLISKIRSNSYPLQYSEDLNRLVDRIGDAQYVLIGEASHGTSNYYSWRARLSQRLIREKGFSFVAVEGDWPDCYSINRYVKGYKDSGKSTAEILYGFERWPTWMWANWETAAFVEWLRDHNSHLTRGERVGFYGLDVYSLRDSMEAIIDYLQRTDPEAVTVAKKAYQCFEPYGYGEYAEAYAVSTVSSFVPETCEEDVVKLLLELRQKVKQYPEDGEAAFDAEQNAYVAVGAEKYYRAMISGGSSSWNVRDLHMADTLDRLMSFYGSNKKAIVWAHNTHIGDARATDMADDGMFNIGQLVRERHSDDGVVLVGFGSHRGGVIASHEWGAPMQNLVVPRSVEGSWEDILHRASHENKLLILDEIQGDPDYEVERGHRAIGVVYNPAFEQYGNYVPTNLPGRYDAFLYLDETEALHPLHLQQKEELEPPETYPWGV